MLLQEEMYKHKHTALQHVVLGMLTISQQQVTNSGMEFLYIFSKHLMWSQCDGRLLTEGFVPSLLTQH